MYLLRRLCPLLLCLLLVPTAGLGQSNEQQLKLQVNWDKVERTWQTAPTLQVVVNPPLRRGSAVHDNACKAVQDLGADYVRYVPWLPYPKLGVAELEPPRDGKTWWDFR